MIESLPKSCRLLDSNLPERRFNIVVFPQPDGPTIAVKVPGENFPEQGFRIVLIFSCFMGLPIQFVSC